MGCDIHIVMQLRINNEWITAYNPHLSRKRDYCTFAIYADVRNYDGIAPISTPRGYPDGFKEPPMFFADHSFSWLGGDEILARWKLLSPQEKPWFILMQSHVEEIEDAIGCRTCEPEDIRFVFGFDN